MAEISARTHRPQDSFGYLVQVFSRDLDRRMKVALKEVDLDIKLFANLMALGQKDGVTQRQIAQRMNFPEYFTSRNIDALVKAGFVDRQVDPTSRRSFLIYLTPAGKAKADLLPAIVRRVNDETLAALTKSEREQMISLLQKAAGFQVQS